MRQSSFTDHDCRYDARRRWNAQTARSREPPPLYAGTTEQLRADAWMHRIAEKLPAEYTT